MLLKCCNCRFKFSYSAGHMLRWTCAEITRFVQKCQWWGVRLLPPLTVYLCQTQIRVHFGERAFHVNFYVKRSVRRTDADPATKVEAMVLFVQGNAQWGGFNTRPPPRPNSEVLTKPSRIPSSVENTYIRNSLIRIRVSLMQIEWNPWLGGYRPQIPILSVLNWICWTPSPPKKKSWVHHWLVEITHCWQL
jgi:hypothetical protein